MNHQVTKRKEESEREKREVSGSRRGEISDNRKEIPAHLPSFDEIEIWGEINGVLKGDASGVTEIQRSGGIELTASNRFLPRVDGTCHREQVVWVIP